MEIAVDVIIYFMKSIVLNLYTYICFKKISNNKDKNYFRLILVFILCLLLSIICTYIEFNINSFISVVLVCFLYGSIIGFINKNKIGYSIVITIISYAICSIFYVLSVMMGYIIYGGFKIDNLYINFAIILVIESIFLIIFIKTKRFRNGFNIIKNKLNSDYIDIIILNISIIFILIYCLFGTIYEQIAWNLLITLIFLCFTMFIIIQKTLTMYYKQKLLNDTLQHYEHEIKSKDSELERLKAEKFNISKVTHEFYNRQKALELLVKNNVSNNENNVEEKASPNVLRIIKSLTEEYSNELTNFKELPKLEITEIPEIDNMFKYMQSECAKNNIEFKLKVVGNIFPLINNIISKNKLETLIGDHIRDAINAVKSSNTENKEILAILGIKDNKYELSIFDTGIDFKIDTLIKLGLEAVTTNSENGGSGIGFLTTFETMNQTKASLIITEFPQNKDRYYTKSVTIRFDGENKYKICSHRAEEIEAHNEDKRIIVEKI